MKIFQFRSVEHRSNTNLVKQKLDLKNLEFFDWSKITFNWSNNDRNIQSQTKTLIAISIGRETGSIDRNSRKNNFLKNRAILCKNSSKHSKMYVYEMKMLLKNTCIEPRFPKNKIFNQISLNSQTANMFCIKLKEFSNLIGQTKITYNNMYKV